MADEELVAVKNETKVKTKYLVLREVESTTGAAEVAYEPHGEVEAHSSRDALRQVANALMKTADDPKDVVGTFVAVPVRSFKPEPVRFEVVTKPLFGE